jgi:hypothetical protein
MTHRRDAKELVSDREPSPLLGIWRAKPRGGYGFRVLIAVEILEIRERTATVRVLDDPTRRRIIIARRNLDP